MFRHSFNKGVALITVMLITALATVLAVSMTSSQQINIHRTTNIINYEQAYQYIAGAESWAKVILRRDFKDNKTDSVKDDWATILPALPIEGGKLAGKIVDMQSRFNLNNLVQNGKRQKQAVDWLKNLFQILSINEDIIPAIIDWIDSNETIELSGAEDNDYLNIKPAYRAANQKMYDLSELLLVKGMDFESYEKLFPYVCVLNSETAVNVNTASAEVLSSVIKGLSVEEAKSIVDEREKVVYDKLDDFFNHPLLKNKNIKKTGLSVTSNYFQLDSSVQIEKNIAEFSTFMYRDDEGRVLILSRSRSAI